MRTRNIIKLVGIIFAAVLVWRIVALLIPDNDTSPGRFARQPIAVQIEPVRYENIQEARQLTGTVHPLYQYIIAPKVSGRVIRINKRIGDWVSRGETVASIDDAEYQQAVLEAEANLRIAQASLKETESQFALSKQELERVRSLQEKGIASPSELDAALTNYDAQQSRLKLAQAQE